MTNSIEDGRNALRIGGKVGELITLQHPTSGDTYAAIVTPERDGLLWVAGPLHYTDDAQAFIDNQFSGDMEADADWLAEELTKHNAWGRIL